MSSSTLSVSMLEKDYFRLGDVWRETVNLAEGQIKSFKLPPELIQATANVQKAYSQAKEELESIRGKTSFQAQAVPPRVVSPAYDEYAECRKTVDNLLENIRKQVLDIIWMQNRYQR